MFECEFVADEINESDKIQNATKAADYCWRVHCGIMDSARICHFNVDSTIEVDVEEKSMNYLMIGLYS